MNQNNENNRQPRQLDSDTPTYNELLDSISKVEDQVEAQDYMVYSFSKEADIMDEVMEDLPVRDATPKADAPKGRDARHTPVDESYPDVNAEAANTVFTHPADDVQLARETNGKIPLPDYAAQGLDDFVVPPDNALNDNDADEARHHHENQPYSPANQNKPQNGPADAYPSGDSAPFYSAPEEGDGPGTPTVQQQAGMPTYDASPDDLPPPV